MSSFSSANPFPMQRELTTSARALYPPREVVSDARRTFTASRFPWVTEEEIAALGSTRSAPAARMGRRTAVRSNVPEPAVHDERAAPARFERSKGYAHPSGARRCAAHAFCVMLRVVVAPRPELARAPSSASGVSGRQAPGAVGPRAASLEKLTRGAWLRISAGRVLSMATPSKVPRDLTAPVVLTVCDGLCAELSDRGFPTGMIR
jgi:hypothetical protein